MRQSDLEALQERLKWDTPFFAEHVAKIIDKRARLSPLLPREPQLRLDRALEQQREQGKPMRAIVLKARKLGFSTWTQAKLIQRVTQHQNQKALVIAQDNDTASELFEIGRGIWANLPADEDLNIKPEIVNRRRGRYMKFGNPSSKARDAGHLGINSSIEVDTANEFDAGRGYTYHLVHCSEVAFWPDPKKLTALLNAVPDEPETMIVLESTANGHNHFKGRWDRAVAGESLYIPVFAAWHEDPDLVLPFDTEEDEEQFASTIGQGSYGEDEPMLQERYGCTLEQLHWRRQAIVDKAGDSLDVFNQEFPHSPEVAFISTGRTVFSMQAVSRVLHRCETTDPQFPSPDVPGPELGILKAKSQTTRRSRGKLVEVPTGPEWWPAAATGFGGKHPWWRIWIPPSPERSYVIACDPAGGEEQTTTGDTAWHAIQVIDHETREQVAEWRGRIDPDLVADELYLAGHYYNEGWLGVEMTGGWGASIARKLWFDYGYRKMYFRKSLEQRREKQMDRLGWDTNRVSKRILEDGATEMLREGTDGIKSRLLATEMTTYVADERGRTGPDADAFSDLLMAWMIAQQIAQEKPTLCPNNRKPPPTFTPKSRKTGW